DENDLGAPFQSKSITVTFACTSTEDSARFGVCGTRCVDFDGVDHCGGCAISCATGQTCRARQCVPAT
ncbi:MAG TPA: hypothetical protein VF316_11520, partial [Polyangiaceae bacterium]